MKSTSKSILSPLLLLLSLISCQPDDHPPERYTLTTTADQGTVAKQPNKSNYAQGDTVTLTATAFRGYTFGKWEGVPLGKAQENPLRLTMDAAKSLTASFVKTYALAVIPPTHGVVAKDPDKAEYAQGERVSLRAIADSGYAFMGWTGGDVPLGKGRQSPLTLTVDAAKTLYATFAKKTHTLTVSASEGGSAAHHTEGDTAILTAKASIGYAFTGWTGAGVPLGKADDNPLRVARDATKSITATFAHKTHRLNLGKVINGGVKRDPDKAEYLQGERVSLTAISHPGYLFVGWSGEAVPLGKSQENSLTLTMDTAKTLTATFAYSRVLTVIPPEHGAISIDPDKAKYAHRETVSLTAKPADGYSFDRWEGVPVGSERRNPLNLSMDDDKTLTARFIKTYALWLSPPKNGAITIQPDKVKYANGETVSLTAKADLGYLFTGWSGAAVPLGKDQDNPLTVTVDEAYVLTAHFVKVYPLTIAPPAHGRVAQQPDKALYHKGDTVTLTAIPDESSAFTGWAGVDVPLGKHNDNPLILTMDAAKKVVATFEAEIFLDANGITLKATPLAQAGKTYTFNGKEYIVAADKATLVAALKAGEDMSRYITSRVTDMSYLFYQAYNFNQDISAWDVSRVTNMRYMFERAYKFNQDIGAWDVSKVTHMYGMFERAYRFNQDIGRWDVSQVTNMYGMFFLATAFNQDIGNWDVRSIRYRGGMSGMFYEARAFNQDLSRWCVEKIKRRPSFFFDSNRNSWNKKGRLPRWGVRCPQ